jgi:hypothetical protein
MLEVGTVMTVCNINCYFFSSLIHCERIELDALICCWLAKKLYKQLDDWLNDVEHQNYNTRAIIAP